jgi:hypothetical protein
VVRLTFALQIVSVVLLTWSVMQRVGVKRHQNELKTVTGAPLRMKIAHMLLPPAPFSELT